MLTKISDIKIEHPTGWEHEVLSEERRRTLPFTTRLMQFFHNISVDDYPQEVYEANALEYAQSAIECFFSPAEENRILDGIKVLEIVRSDPKSHFATSLAISLIRHNLERNGHTLKIEENSKRTVLIVYPELDCNPEAPLAAEDIATLDSALKIHAPDFNLQAEYQKFKTNYLEFFETDLKYRTKHGTLFLYTPKPLTIEAFEIFSRLAISRGCTLSLLGTEGENGDGDIMYTLSRMGQTFQSM